ncbi:MAG: SMI1/KNR4 family protein [Oscillibacter sp.]|nr:SMI1/KNR4 family protein [Oscillibacter sp.]
MDERFFECLQSRGWKIERYEGAAPGVPETLRKRYPASERWLAWIGGVKSAVNGDEATWLLCAEDYAGQGGAAFRWNEWELLSLASADGDPAWEAEIRRFWDAHLPIIMSVADGRYSYYALSAADGAVVSGGEPEFEVCETAAASLEAFLEKITEGGVLL